MLRGLNFSQKKYKIINKNTFIPHIRTSFHASVPKLILDNFPLGPQNAGLFKIDNKIRIKKLHKEGESLVISLKAEKNAKFVTVLNIKPEENLLDRNSKKQNSMVNFIPKYTDPNKGSTPIYVFNHKNKLIVGGYYKKDLKIQQEIKYNNKIFSALGLYFAEGGKVASSFTNSWPDAINNILDFMEKIFGLERKKIKASIYCNPNLKEKRKSLEEFWSKKTGIENFSKNLHFGKNSRSPQGTLEMYFCSIVIKEIINNMLNKILEYPVDKINIIKGILSGDGSPIQQTKYVITHHLPFDKLSPIKNEKIIDEIFSEFSRRNNSGSKFVIYPSWEQNKNLLLNDIYKFNLMNRLKFAYRFLNLPRTEKEMDSDKTIQIFKRKQYRLITNEIKAHYKELADLELFDEKKMEEILNAYSLH